MKYHRINTFLHILALFFFVNGKRIPKGYGRQGEMSINADEPQLAQRKKCWIGLNTPKLTDDMDTLENSYEEIRTDYEKAVGLMKFDKEMLEAMLESRGVAKRLTYGAHTFPGGTIPAGINLGGYSMVAFNRSVLLFHRMKLRNQTHFRVNFVQSSLMDMTLSAHLSLHDLHLFGSYQRIKTEGDPSILFYRPTFGRMELLLKDVQYKMEGRYRLLRDRLTIEHVISDLTVPELLMTYMKNATCPESQKISPSLMDEFLHRLKNDLDKWLKDYFNDYLVEMGLASPSDNEQFLKFDIKKAKILNAFVDNALTRLKKRMYQLKALAVTASDFTIFIVNGMEIRLRRGVLRGLDSIHRKSVTTTRKQNKVRHVNTIVGFGTLKLEYHYEALTGTGMPALEGIFILTSDELIARLDMELIKEPDTANLHIDFMEHMKPETLTVEGALNRELGNFKHVLENHIVSLMSNVLYHRIRLLSTLTKCDPELPGYLDPGEVYPLEEENLQIESVKVENNEEKRNNPSQIYDGIKKENVNEEVRKVDVGYGVKKEQSIELVLPAEGNLPAKTIKIDYIQNLTMDQIKGDEDEPENGWLNPESKSPEIADDNNDPNSNLPALENKSPEFTDNNNESKKKNSEPENKSVYNKKERKVDVDYGVKKEQSIELALPAEENQPAKIIKIDYVQNFTMDKKNGNSELENKSPEFKHDNNESNKEQSEPENKYSEKILRNGLNIDPPEPGELEELQPRSAQNLKYDYGVERQDSAEIEFPAQKNKPSQKKKLLYKEKFSLKEVTDDDNTKKSDTLETKPKKILREYNVESAQTSENKTQNMKYDFGVKRKDSAEFEYVPEGEKASKNMKVKYNEDFSLKEV